MKNVKDVLATHTTSTLPIVVPIADKLDFKLLSLDLSHYYKTLQNNYNDKLQYIEKLKCIRNDLKTDLANSQKQLEDYQALLDKYQFPDIQVLSNFLEKHSKDK